MENVNCNDTNFINYITKNNIYLIIGTLKTGTFPIPVPYYPYIINPGSPTPPPSPYEGVTFVDLSQLPNYYPYISPGYNSQILMSSTTVILNMVNIDPCADVCKLLKFAANASIGLGQLTIRLYRLLPMISFMSGIEIPQNKTFKYATINQLNDIGIHIIERIKSTDLSQCKKEFVIKKIIEKLDEINYVNNTLNKICDLKFNNKQIIYIQCVMNTPDINSDTCGDSCGNTQKNIQQIANSDDNIVYKFVMYTKFILSLQNNDNNLCKFVYKYLCIVNTYSN